MARRRGVRRALLPLFALLAGCAATGTAPVPLEAPSDASPAKAAAFEAKALELERAADREVALARRDLAAPVYDRLIALRAAGDLPAAREARAYAEVAVSEHERARLRSAESYYRRALEVLDAQEHDEPELRAIVALSLGILLRSSERTAEAAPLFERAVALRAGGSGPELAIALGESAGALTTLRKPDEAIERYRRALAIWERTPDSELWVAQTLANLALLHRARGEHDSARSLLERALPIYERKLPADDPTLQRVRALLASTKPSAAAPAATPAPSAADGARELDRQGAALLDQREYARARPLLERAVAIHERGVTAPVELGASLSYLGRTYAGLGERDAARVTLRRSLALLEPALGKLDPLTLATRASLENLR